MMGILSVAYIMALPVYLLAALFYDFFLRPKKLRVWEHKFMCQRCGHILETEVQDGMPASAQVRA
jgi:hypothetical protein